jgi:hypothetical protein
MKIVTVPAGGLTPKRNSGPLPGLLLLSIVVTKLTDIGSTTLADALAVAIAA